MEGQKLKQDGEAFRQKLNTQQLFENWKKKVRGQCIKSQNMSDQTGKVSGCEVTSCEGH